jgi:hypothetical protein
VKKDESITKKPEVRTLYLRRVSDLHRSDQFEKYHHICKPDDEPTSGKLLLELRKQWNSGPGKTYLHINRTSDLLYINNHSNSVKKNQQMNHLAQDSESTRLNDFFLKLCIVLPFIILLIFFSAILVA